MSGPPEHLLDCTWLGLRSCSCWQQSSMAGMGSIGAQGSYNEFYTQLPPRSLQLAFQTQRFHSHRAQLVLTATFAVRLLAAGAAAAACNDA